MSYSEHHHGGFAAQRAIRLLAATLATVAVLGASTTTGKAFAGACQHRNTEANQLSHHTSARTTLCLLNAERRVKGLSPLQLSHSLSQAASAHSHDMVSRRYSARTAPGGRRPRPREVRNPADRSSRIDIRRLRFSRLVEWRERRAREMAGKRDREWEKRALAELLAGLEDDEVGAQDDDQSAHGDTARQLRSGWFRQKAGWGAVGMTTGRRSYPHPLL